MDTPPAKLDRDGNGMDVSGMGWRLAITGRDIMLFLTIVASTGSIAYTNYLGFQAVHHTMAILLRQHEVLHEDAVSAATETRLLTYMLSLPPEKRPLLIPPPELYGRLRSPALPQK